MSTFRDCAVCWFLVSTHTNNYSFVELAVRAWIRRSPGGQKSILSVLKVSRPADRVFLASHRYSTPRAMQPCMDARGTCGVASLL
jgi:hypothetical protein